MRWKILRAFGALASVCTLSACAILSPTPRPPTPTIERILATPASLATPTPVATAAPRFTPTPVPLTGAAAEFDSARALAHTRMLAEKIGKRPADSDANHLAGDYIVQKFEELGFEVSRQDFSFDEWRNVNTIFELKTPTKRKLNSAPLTNSPAGGADAEVMVVTGVGTPEDFAKTDVSGRVALVRRGTISFLDKARNAERAGAVAVLIYNNAPGDFTGELDAATKIPVLAISDVTGKELADAMLQGPVSVFIASDTGVFPRPAQNIIARRPGDDKTIVIGAHYDSAPVGQGAVANASGVGTMLELARAVGAADLESTLIFVAFDAQEPGLFGSKEYVEKLTNPERKNIKAMINLDMVGGGTGALVVAGNGPASDVAREAARSIGIEVRNFSLGPGAESDYLAFQSVGIDTVFISREYNLVGTAEDVMTQVKPDFLAQAGRAAARSIELLDK